MARKGNQPKRGIDQTSSKSNRKDPGLKVVADDLLDSEQHSSPLMAGINSTSLAGDGRKKNRKARNVVTRGDLVDDMDNGPSVHDNSVSCEDVQDIGRIHSNMSHARNHRHKSVNGTSGHATNESYTANRLDQVNYFRHLALESLRPYAMSILRTSNGWLEKHRPFFISVADKINGARDYLRWKFFLTYPIVLRWLFHVGNIMLLVSMLWLDCSLRGMASFLRMGTTSFLAVLWFSIFSVVAMIGTFKFLLIMAVAALLGVLVGFVISLSIIAVSGAVILWLYGSFWTTSFIIVLAGLAFIANNERLAVLITSVYSIYCAWAYAGWLGLLLALNLSFISSDALIYFLKLNINEQRNESYARTDGFFNEGSSFAGKAHAPHSDIGSGESVDRNAGDASTSGTDSEITSEDEVVRLLNCADHYSALGLSRYQQVDVSILKREYRKKAMLVHPDKNMGNEKAAEAFKKLQNAYEILLDSLKRKAYDDELRREELLNYFRFQSTSQKNGRHGSFPNGFTHSEGDGEDPSGETRRIVCKKCGSFHMWFQTKKSKLKARWCQDCKDFHQAKDGDGWVEQSSQPLLFGILQKVDQPIAYVCADSKVYDATEWYICQGMRCPANSHKPSFHVNTNITKNSHGKGSSSSHRGGAAASNMEESMTEEEFFEWLHSAMQSGGFENFTGNDTPETNSKYSSKSSGGPQASGGSGSSSKRKKKGKKQW